MNATASVGRPWSIQLSPVEGCTRLCYFCGLNGIRSRPNENIQLMSEAVWARVVAELPAFAPTARYEIAMHGEPLLHPLLADWVAALRRALPKCQIQVTTNGGPAAGRMAEVFGRLFNAGVNFIILDTYRPERERLRAEALALAPDCAVRDFYAECVPAGWSPWHNHGNRVQRTVILMDDLALRDGEVASRQIMNHAGNGRAKPPLPAPLARTCTLPFRELAICHDGDVNVCCMDWGHEYRCGNVLTDRLADIWQGEAFAAARRVLYARSRGFTPCAQCDAPSGARAGLLPAQPGPDADTWTAVDRTHAASPKRNGRPAWRQP